MFRIIKRFVVIIISIPVLYVIISMILTFITVNSNLNEPNKSKIIFLTTNGVHSGIIIPERDLSIKLKKGLKYTKYDKYLSFGWGDKNFYLNTPTWGDLTIKNAFKALFCNGSTVIHLTRYFNKLNDWAEIKITQKELDKLNNFINNSFQVNLSGDKILLKNKGYGYQDDFYEAKGSYSFYKTCNTWVNLALKRSGIKSCLWTPYAFRLIEMNR